MSDKICLVLVTNDSYFDKMLFTLNGVLTNGYSGEICVVIGDDLLNSEKLKHYLFSQNNITIKHFPDIKFTKNFIEKFNSLSRDEHWTKKIFQYHKFNLFREYFKKWDYIFYLDSGCHVYNSINRIIETKKSNKLLAHSDAYPSYEWKLDTQFIQDDKLYNEIKLKYNLNIDYPQTTIMLYDTNIIEGDTFSNLYNLAEECKISKTNDQGIIALYFAGIKSVWEQIPLGDEEYWYYDYCLRPEKRQKPPIILKTPM